MNRIQAEDFLKCGNCFSVATRMHEDASVRDKE